eukprot:6490437-Amphidinium_carterae.2
MGKLVEYRQMVQHEWHVLHKQSGSCAVMIGWARFAGYVDQYVTDTCPCTEITDVLSQGLDQFHSAAGWEMPLILRSWSA